MPMSQDLQDWVDPSLDHAGLRPLMRRMLASVDDIVMCRVEEYGDPGAKKVLVTIMAVADVTDAEAADVAALERVQGVRTR